MANITDFKDWGKRWFEIGYGISMAHNLAPEDIKIIGATKGSIIIELSVIAGIATTVSGIILAALKVADRILELRKKAEEIRGMKLKNDKLAQDIEKEAEIEKKAGVATIMEEIVKKLEIKREAEGDKIPALKRSIENLVDFTENGGEVDFVIPEEKTDSNENKEKPDKSSYIELRTAFKEIRSLEHRIALLEKYDEKKDVPEN